MDLHAEIMNIPANIVLTGPGGVGNVHSNPYIAYKEGHRDARHAAAELALRAQSRIEKLEYLLEEVLKDSGFPCLFDELQSKIQEAL